MAPVAAEGGDPATQELLATVPDAAGSNFFRTLVHHPRIFKRWVKYGSVLLEGALPPRDRELLILRTIHHTQCEYVWAHHVPIALQTGLSREEIARVREASSPDAGSTFDAALLVAVDELVDDCQINDSTWETLARGYEEPQLIEVPMVAGVFLAMGFTLNSLGVEVEADRPSSRDAGGR